MNLHRFNFQNYIYYLLVLVCIVFASCAVPASTGSKGSNIWMGRVGQFFVKWEKDDVVIISPGQKDEYRFSDAVKLVAFESAARSAGKPPSSSIRRMVQNDFDAQNTLRVVTHVSVRSVAGPLITFAVSTMTTGGGGISSDYTSRLVTIDLSRPDALEKTKRTIEEAVGVEEFADGQFLSAASLRNYFTDNDLKKGLSKLNTSSSTPQSLDAMIADRPVITSDGNQLYLIPESFRGFVLNNFDKDKVTLSVQVFSGAGESYEIQYFDISLDRNPKFDEVLNTGTTTPFESGMDVYAQDHAEIAFDQDLQ